MTKRKPAGYWESLENTIAEAMRAMEEQEWDTLPTQTELNNHGYNSLNKSIIKYHGGIRTFRTKLGQQNPDIKPNGYWQNIDNVLKEVNEAMEKHNWKTLPPHSELVKHGYNSLTIALRNHGGYTVFRKKN